MDRRSLTFRVLTAVVGIPLLLGAAWLGGWWWAALVAVLAIVAVVEYLRLYPELGAVPRWAVIVGVGIIVPLRWWAKTPEGDEFFTPLVAVWSVLLYAVILRVVSSGDPSRALQESGWGTLYIGMAAAVLVEWGFAPGFRIILWFFAVIWANDVGAYFGGYALGRHKLAPQLSPGKTWEGAGLGLIAGAVAAWAAAPLVGLTGGEAIVVSLPVIVGSQLGDLFESAIKRRAGVKDSGVLFPGHGGVLDRFDGVFAAAPVAYLLLHWWAP